MYYVFNKDGIFVATCDIEPNIQDLQARGEYYVENNEDLKVNRVVGGKFGGIYETVETAEELTNKKSDELIKQRIKILNNTDWITTRHFEEKMLGKENTTLSDEQITEFLEYRQTLRDITKLDGFPFITLPQQPEFLE